MTIPANLDAKPETNALVASVRHWRKLGVKRATYTPFPKRDDQAFLFVPAGQDGPAFLTIKNFEVIKKYNNADLYALAVGLLADRFAAALSWR